MIEARQWQATIWVGDPEEPITFYAAALGQLSAKLSDWFADHQPQHFANLPTIAPERTSYQRESSGDIQHLDEILNPKDTPPDARWKRSTDEWSWEESKPFSKAAARFISEDVMYEPGPDYQETAIQDDVFQLHRIKTVRLEPCESQSQIAQINELLRRGWYILKLQEIRESTPQLLLGHVEPGAF